VRCRPCGDSGLLVELDDLTEVHGLYAQIVERDLPGVTGLVPAARTLLIHLDPHTTSPDALARLVAGIEPSAAAPRTGPEVEVPVIYDGEDLEEVGDLTGLGARGVVAAHTARSWTVGFVGFAPGFAYLVGHDERLHVPRRTRPRTDVPAGAVALADGYSGIYPRRSPGGWQLIGHTEAELWGVTRDPPSLLQPGATVRFVAVG
jgi:KipI family sensor histidine kinase inhibitor